MNKNFLAILGAFTLFFSVNLLAQDFKNGEKLTIGITLHPYYSFVSHIVGDKADIVPLIGAGYNPHNYNPLPDDMKRAQSLDAIKAAGVNVLFAEKFFAGKLAETIQSETGVEMFSFSHISDGEYSPDLFENEMRYNLDSLKAAIESTR